MAAPLSFCFPGVNLGGEVRPGPGLGSADPGQGLRLGERRRVDSVGMSELVWREAPADPRFNSDLVQLQPGGAGRPGMSACGSGDYAEQGADRQHRAVGQPWS